MSVMASTLVLVAALAVSVTTAYPTKDEEAYYYNRLHELPDNYYKDTRNLDGIGSTDELPLFAILAKAEEDLRSQKGSEHKNYGFGSGSHLDGIGGGHLVRDQESEQGLRQSIVNLLQPAVDVGASGAFGVLRRYPEESQNLKHKSGASYEFDTNKMFLKDVNRPTSSTSRSDLSSLGGVSTKDLYAVGGGHLLESRRDLDALGGGHLLGSRRELDYLGGGHLLGSKRELDYLGGGHLLGSKRALDYLGGGHLLGSRRDLDALGGGHLLGSTRNIDFTRKFNHLNGLQSKQTFLRDLENVFSNEIHSNKNYRLESYSNCSSHDRFYNLIKRYLQAIYDSTLPNSATLYDTNIPKETLVGPNSPDSESEINIQPAPKIHDINFSPYINQDLVNGYGSVKEPPEETVLRKGPLVDSLARNTFEGV